MEQMVRRALRARLAHRARQVRQAPPARQAETVKKGLKAKKANRGLQGRPVSPRRFPPERLRPALGPRLRKVKRLARWCRFPSRFHFPKASMQNMCVIRQNLPKGKRKSRKNSKRPAQARQNRRGLHRATSAYTRASNRDSASPASVRHTPSAQREQARVERFSS